MILFLPPLVPIYNSTGNKEKGSSNLFHLKHRKVAEFLLFDVPCNLEHPSDPWKRVERSSRQYQGEQQQLRPIDTHHELANPISSLCHSPPLPTIGTYHSQILEWSSLLDVLQFSSAFLIACASKVSIALICLATSYVAGLNVEKCFSISSTTAVFLRTDL
ncbi:hypothetical protein EYC80_006921 [Monilinia laxa]|uniref:Uncharacterized protein n=1 Tax=Monilinia laxa TaxID=61186 RepID=A0A5N6JZM3_MONLA|nr:hypothetical protein EYC80_006921 [Monilinia laxa]